MSKAIAWSAAEEARLRRLYPRTESGELARLFARTAKAINSRAKLLGVRKAIGHGGKATWTRKMDRQLRELYPGTLTRELAAKLGVSLLATHNRAHKLAIRKSTAYLERKAQEGAKRLTVSGIAHRFYKGQTPPNKGMRRPGYSIGRGRMRETQFKKGQSPGNTMPLWSFRWYSGGSTSGVGYLLLKTGKPGPKPINGWEFVHKLVWEQAHGLLPSWRVARIWWKDGDHGNCSLSNLELVASRDHVARTWVHNLPAPLKEVIQLQGVLKRKIRNREDKLNGKEHIAGSTGPSLRDAGSAV
jgi:hypothetical protein